MKHTWYAGVCASLILAGCSPQMGAQLTSVDGTVVEPIRQDQFTTECQAKAQVSNSGVPVVTGAGGAIEMSQAQQAAFHRCMAEKGIKVTYAPLNAPRTKSSAVEQPPSEIFGASER